jgi:ribosomal protein L4
LTDGAIFVLHHDGSLKKPDTKKIITLYEKLAMVGKKVLVIVDGFGKESKSFNNIPKTSIKFPQQVSVKDILNNKLIVVFEKAFDQFIKVGG